MSKPDLKLPKGMFADRGRLYYRIFRNGVEFRGPLGFEATKRNIDAATEKLVESRQLIQSGRESELRLEVIPFNEAVKTFLDWKRGESKKESTFGRIRTSFTSLRAMFGKTPVHCINEGAVDHYIAWRRNSGIKEVTLANDISALGAFFRYAARQRWIAQGRNPLKSPDFSKPSRKGAVREVILTEAEKIMYLAAAQFHPDLFDAARLLLHTGMRPNKELFPLEWPAVDLEAGVIRVLDSKTEAGKRTIPLTATARQILRTRREQSERRIAERLVALHRWAARPDSPTKTQRVKEAQQALEAERRYVFPTRGGGHLQDLYEAHEAALKVCGLSFVPYSLRHTFASEFLNGDCRNGYQPYGSIGVAMAILGHTDPRVTMRYVKVHAEATAAAVLRFSAPAPLEKGATA